MSPPKANATRPHHKFTSGVERAGAVFMVKNAIRSITPRITKKEPIGTRRSSMFVYQNQIFKRMQRLPAMTASRMGRIYQGTRSSGGIVV
jgi:hypothetical protein